MFVRFTVYPVISPLWWIIGSAVQLTLAVVLVNIKKYSISTEPPGTVYVKEMMCLSVIWYVDIICLLLIQLRVM